MPFHPHHPHHAHHGQRFPCHGGSAMKKLLFLCVAVIAVLSIGQTHGVFRYFLTSRGMEKELEEVVEKFLASGQHRVHRPVYPQRAGDQPVIHMATVACGKKIPEAIVMLKSTALFASSSSSSSSRIVFHVFTEEDSIPWFLDEETEWPQAIRKRFELKLYTLTLPNDPDRKGWTNPFFRPCSNHRLFLHSVIPSVDSVIYLDADLVVMFPVERLWRMFHQFNASHLVALVGEYEDPIGGYYWTLGKIPHVLPSGVNSGVMLMNLTRIARSRWTKTMVEYSQTYKARLQLGDQDLINIYLRYHPGQHLLLDCAFNYRTDHCETREKAPSSICKSAEDQGALILHGSRGSFSQNPCFQAVYSAFSKFRLGQNASELLKKVHDKLKKGGRLTPCVNIASSILQELVRSVSDVTHHRQTNSEKDSEKED